MWSELRVGVHMLLEPLEAQLEFDLLPEAAGAEKRAGIVALQRKAHGI
jgi:hypothetical protein